MNIYEMHYDVIVVGGGLSGVCAAIASARHGAKTALIQNRPVLGGNASSEIKMHICGASEHDVRPNARETGILEELLLENKNRNPQHSFSVFDTVLWEKTTFQEGLELYLNTQLTDVVMKDNRVSEITAIQLTTEKVFHFSATVFIDTTGDATLAFLSGAEYMTGREGKEVYHEQYAPEKSDRVMMGSTLLFHAADMGQPMPFTKPWWANTYTEQDFNGRPHSDFSSGYWWVELGGDELDTITDAEDIRDELLKAVYGVWDHIKNSGHHPAENWVLEWVGCLPGKRESRRVLGDYILKEQDCLTGKLFDDAVAYGGWPLDLHTKGGFSGNSEPNQSIHLEEMYSIPYRCLYSRNIENLMVGGRAVSASNVAFGSTRIMATCAVIGQAEGTAAAMAVKHGIIPKEIGTNKGYLDKLQQMLLKDDCYIPGQINHDEGDLAKMAVVNCSTWVKGGEASNTINGISRTVKDSLNCWISDEMSQSGEWLSLSYEKAISVQEVRLTFDSNLSEEIMISLSTEVLARQVPGMPPRLIRDYRMLFYHKNELIRSETIENNYLRCNVHTFSESICCDKIKIHILHTYGNPHARIFEVRVY